jgi:hypothetical protein
MTTRTAVQYESDGMGVEDEIKVVLLEILRVGLLRIRGLGSSGYADECSLEADHLHNLPWVIQSFSEDSLLFYWNVARTSYLSPTSSNVEAFTTLWAQLEKLMQEYLAT